MEEVLAYSEKRYQNLFLFTNEPELYIRHGFSSFAEHKFEVSVDAGANSFRQKKLDLRTVEDLSIVRDFIGRRAAVSDIYGVLNHPGLFTFNFVDFDTLFNAKNNTLVVYKVEHGVLALYDVVSEKIPSVDSVLESIPKSFEKVELYFTPVNRFHLS